jgi:hypothetical protein
MYAASFKQCLNLCMPSENANWSPLGSIVASWSHIADFFNRAGLLNAFPRDKLIYEGSTEAGGDAWLDKKGGDPMNRLVIACIAALSWALAGLPTASAKIVRLDMNAKSAIGLFRPGEYVRLDGRIVGELSPASEAIPDLDKAPRNARGMVEYSAKLVIVMPVDPAKGNGALLIDIPNRGRPISHSLYNSPRDLPIVLGPIVDPGTGFLEDQGYTIAVPSWELGQGAELPSFAGPDGKPLYIEGVGFAIIRDTADFLANASRDSAGQANPLAGSVSRILALGYSQTGRFLRTALLHGFNMAEGRRVFA